MHPGTTSPAPPGTGLFQTASGLGLPLSMIAHNDYPKQCFPGIIVRRRCPVSPGSTDEIDVGQDQLLSEVSCFSGIGKVLGLFPLFSAHKGKKLPDPAVF